MEKTLRKLSIIWFLLLFSNLMAGHPFAQECTISSDCDDGMWCTGTETCVSNVCVPGIPPCDDSDPCTTDPCNEDSDVCLVKECAAINLGDPCCDDPICIQSPICTADVTIKPESVEASPGDIGVDVGICLDNPEDLVGSVQLDLCEYTVGGDPIDYMECMDCKLTERTPVFNCEVLELPDGCCRLILFRSNPDFSINTGLCDVATFVYRIFEFSEDYIGTPCIVKIPVNIVISNHEGFALAAAGLSGEVCFPDADSDGIPDAWDNCPDTPNPNQEDTYPPGGNDIGDACDCEGNFNCDQDTDADDVIIFLTHFGRNQWNNPCTNENQCKGDFSCDGDVDADDVTKFLEDFGRSQWNNPCPTCVVGDWCVYE